MCVELPSPMSDTIEPFHLQVPQTELDDLRRRLAQTRWPEQEPVGDWRQGVPLEKLRALCAYWADGYDWRRCEAALNALGQGRTTISDLGIHFLHVRSPHEDALPLILSHGWPGSVVEFLKVIGPLTDPTRYGGEARDAFHLVVPSLPGYGFSDRPQTPGWSVERIAGLWVTLLGRLGYHRRFGAQGGDWGAAITAAIGAMNPAGCVGIHLNMAMFSPQPGDEADPSPATVKALALLKRYKKELGGYSKEQSTRPQTLGYALTDSPAGQAAWIYEKFYDWTDNDGNPEDVFTWDELLDNIMLYWLPKTAASSGRLYWESFGEGASIKQEVTVPAGVSVFPKDIHTAPRNWAERSLKQLVYWNDEVERGGHFAAMEQPEIFVREVRACFRLMR